MKELSIEEKAKRYAEAIEKLQNAFYDNNSRMCEEYRNAVLKIIEPIFPELKESEDEKMRAMAIKAVYAPEAQSCIKSWGINPDDVIAWLEKQCEQNLANSAKICKDEPKPTQEIEPTPIFRIGNILKRKGKDYTFRVDRIQGGYYFCDMNNGAEFPIDEQDNWELVEQKPVEWSEEDVRNLNTLIGYIVSKNELGLDYADWLKSLKDRVRLRPKQEWSDDDESMLYGVIETESYMLDVVNRIKEFDVGNDDIRKACTKELDWLKSLKERYTWKPNEEQMKVLEWCMPLWVEPKSKAILESLINDLKKLREE